MSTEELSASLDQLEEELRGAHELDAATAERLRSLVREIQAVVGPGSADEADRPPSLRDRLREFAFEYETEHPRITAIVRQLGDLLSTIGI